MKTAITLEFDTDQLANYTDQFLAQLWHVAQANPAPISDRDAGEIAEMIGREIVKRWLQTRHPELWTHQGKDYYWDELRKHGHWEKGGRFVSDTLEVLQQICDTSGDEHSVALARQVLERE